MDLFLNKFVILALSLPVHRPVFSHPLFFRLIFLPRVEKQENTLLP